MGFLVVSRIDLTDFSALCTGGGGGGDAVRVSTISKYE
jgi:hypothetical protein